MIALVLVATSSLSDEPWFPGAVTGILALAGVLTVALIQDRRFKMRDRANIKTPEPPTTQQVWERLDRTEKVLTSVIVLLGEVADQWQGEHPPVLSKRHVAIVAAAGYMPPEWEPEVTE